VHSVDSTRLSTRPNYSPQVAPPFSANRTARSLALHYSGSKADCALYLSRLVPSFQFPFVEHSQTLRQLDFPHGFPLTDFLQSMLIDSPAHEFSLWNPSDPHQVLWTGNSVSLSPVLNGLGVQQAQIAPLFPMPVRFLPGVDGRPVCNDVSWDRSSDRNRGRRG
jgi:hypothetical protein